MDHLEPVPQYGFGTMVCVSSVDGWSHSMPLSSTTESKKGAGLALGMVKWELTERLRECWSSPSVLVRPSVTDRQAGDTDMEMDGSLLGYIMGRQVCRYGDGEDSLAWRSLEKEIWGEGDCWRRGSLEKGICIVAWGVLAPNEVGQLAESLNRLRELWDLKGFKTDPELALFLLDRTSQDPCRTPCSLPTGQTGQWMMHSAFTTIIPDFLHSKLTQLTVPAPTCQWIKNLTYLTDQRLLVRLGNIASSIRTISTGAPQGCVPSPLLFSLYTNDCTSGDPSVKLPKFADDTTVRSC
ncbi:uncharacterized protein LOC122870669 [Siniperca chuatsi]|uniref:uncharacterized protein LOC122870669 n=1 Tax=Siniperca chuatsi TaxID=119488 RepID=UPI001CE209B9|nr:uncharacterized protein LOC122870669 [Siniperca chuatsi]